MHRVRYAHERQTFGEEIGRHQLVKQMLAKMVAGHRGGPAARLARRLAEEPRPAQHPRDVARQVARDGARRRVAPWTRSRSTAPTATRTSSRWSATCATPRPRSIYEGTSQLHTLIQADYALGYREDRPLRCEPLPAQGFERLSRRARRWADAAASSLGPANRWRSTSGRRTAAVQLGRRRPAQAAMATGRQTLQGR